MTYVKKARESLVSELAIADSSVRDDSPLVDLYLLLVLVKGFEVTREDVHDAWSVWMQEVNPNHQSLLPFGDLAPEVQALDEKYAAAIRQASRKVTA